MNQSEPQLLAEAGRTQGQPAPAGDSEDRNRALVKAMQDGVCIIRLLFDEQGRAVDYRFLQANKAFADQCLLPHPTGRTIRELVPDFEPQWIEKYAEVARSGQGVRFEAEIRSIGGVYDIHAFVPKGCGPDDVAVVFSNTTHRRLAEARLQASEARHAFLLHLHDRLRVLDDAAQIQREAARALGEHLKVSRVGYAEDQGDGQTVAVTSHYLDGVPGIEGRHRYDVHDGGLLQTLRAGETAIRDDIAGDLGLTHAEKAASAGIQLGASVNIPLLKAGRLLAFLFIHQKSARPWTVDEVALMGDVAQRIWAAVERARTERALRQSEARLLRELADVTRLQAVGSVLVENEQAGELFERLLQAALDIVDADAGTIQLLDQESRTLGFLATRGFSDGVVAHFSCVDAASQSPCGIALASGQRGFVVFDEPGVADPDGSNALHLAEGVCCAQSTPLVSRSGLPLGMFSTHWRARRTLGERELRFLDLLGRQAADLIERMQVHGALKEREQRLREDARRKDEFIAILAHELRNPLAPIRNGVELLKAASHDPVVERVRPMMERQVGHMVRLIDDLLDVSRISSGRVLLKREPVNLRSLVGSAAEANRTAIAAAGLELRLELDDSERVLLIDPTRLSQVLANILHNATKFTPPGGLIRVSTALEAAGGDQPPYQLIRISDTGLGIPPDVLPTIFDLFTQVRPDSSARHGGMGIGLALARSLSELHGGSLTAASEGVGRGSEFTVRIPLEAPVASGDTSRPDAAALGLGGLGILVVDDNRDAADSIGLLLAQHEGDVRVCYDMTQALQAFRQTKPELVLLDLGMPGIDGYEGCRMLRRERGTAVRIVALTGWGQEEDRHRSSAAGFDHHLTKPVDFAKLMEIAVSVGKARVERVSSVA